MPSARFSMHRETPPDDARPDPMPYLARRSVLRWFAAPVLLLLPVACSSAASQGTHSATPLPTSSGTSASGGPPAPTASTSGTVAAPAATVVLAAINGSTTLVGAGPANGTIKQVFSTDNSDISAQLIGKWMWLGLFSSVDRIDPATGQATKIKVPGASAGVQLFGDPSAVWASGFGPLLRINPATGRVTGSWNTTKPPFPTDTKPVAAGSGKLYLVDHARRELSSFDGKTLKRIARLPFRLADGLPVKIAGNLLYIADMYSGRVAVINPATGSVRTVRVIRPLAFTAAHKELDRTTALQATADGMVWAYFGEADTQNTGTQPLDHATAFVSISPTGKILSKGSGLKDDYDVLGSAGRLLIVNEFGHLLTVDPTTGATQTPNVAVSAAEIVAAGSLPD